MSFDWTNYLDLAKALHKQRKTFADTEACDRSTISRAYYSVFKLAYNYMEKVDQPQTRSAAGEHHQTYLYFQMHPERTRKKIGNSLQRLKKDREKADYDDEITDGNVQRLAEKSLKSAQKTLQHLRSLRQFDTI